MSDIKQIDLEAGAAFVQEVRMTYGQKIADICHREYLAALNRGEDGLKIEYFSILDNAKEEAGFDPEKSSLAYTRMSFTS